jgi:hypothetical protein
MTDLERTTLKTVAFFAVMNYPLSKLELYKWQMSKERIFDAHELWESARGLEQIQIAHGHVLPANENVEAWMRKKQRCYRLALRKRRRAGRFTSVLRRLFAVKGIALCNTRLPLHYSEDENDIDFFILTKPRRVWNIRLAALLPLKLLGQRPGERRRDAFDLTFFADTSVDSIEHLKCGDDVYLAAWVLMLAPLYDEFDALKEFVLKNDWARNYFPNAWPQIASDSAGMPQLRLPSLLPALLTEWIQRKVVSRKLKEEGSSVVLTERIIKTHTKDVRRNYAEQFTDLCQQLGVS